MHYSIKKTFEKSYIIAILKVNELIEEIYNKYKENYFGRFQLPVGVSFGSKTLYIATQKDGYAKSKHKYLFKKFTNYVSELIIEEYES